MYYDTYSTAPANFFLDTVLGVGFAQETVINHVFWESSVNHKLLAIKVYPRQSFHLVVLVLTSTVRRPEESICNAVFVVVLAFEDRYT